jgi:hypothetical protein
MCMPVHLKDARDSSRRHCTTEGTIRQWFREMEAVLAGADPRLGYVGGENGEVVVATDGPLVRGKPARLPRFTVAPAFNACGDCAPPLIVFRKTEKVTDELCPGLHPIHLGAAVSPKG